ncbi:tagatose-bisphosphate aldolase [Candidatus Wolfebacteria bacterium]|nr:MAG: tagatose-bisphosphate aldolase [Candidatus Wolfebacteria bacterium]
MVKKLREYIADAQERGVAIGHFNISNIEALWGIFRAAQKLDVPVIIGTSEGERDFIGLKQAVALVKSIREEYDYPIFLNADHTYSFEGVKEAIDAGYDAVIFDGLKVTTEENIEITKKCVDYARSVNPDILVEAELGNIGKSSKILDEIPEGAETTDEVLTKPDIAKEFVAATGVDLLAPAVGNLHGMLKEGRNPAINVDRVGEIKNATGVPLVLHGGSGISDDDFTKAIKAGVSVIHINTEIRVAYRDALKQSIQENPDEVAPYRILKSSVHAVQAKVEERLKLFNHL